MPESAKGTVDAFLLFGFRDTISDNTCHNRPNETESHHNDDLMPIVSFAFY